MKKFRFYIKNFGCKVNQYDGQLLGESISQIGERVPAPGSADVVIVNTCAVTRTALSSGRKYVKKIKTSYPGKEIVAVGCAAGKNSKIFNDEGIETIYGFKGMQRPEARLDRFQGHTRGFIKIQQGCRGKCSYCAVRETKKPFYVKPVDRVVEEIKMMSQKHPEIIFCGTNLDFYRDRNGNNLLPGLIKKIKKFEAGFRWRFSSIPPACLSNENLILLREDDKFCRHFHLPLQSGSDKILKMMRRPYNLSILEDRMKNANHFLPGVVFSYDIMVGFDGETEEDFLRTIKFIKKYPPVRVHIFRYSKVRSDYSGGKKVSEKVKRNRLEKLKKVSDSLILKQMEEKIGTIQEVIPENGSTGYTRSYMPVKLTRNIGFNTPVGVEILSVTEGKLEGKVRNQKHFSKFQVSN